MTIAKRFRVAVAASWLMAALLGPGAALADGAQYGEAGLRALDRGAYADAIRYFTRALAAGDLKPDDQELALLNRAKAYLAEGDQPHAIADLRQAVKLNPDDTDAQAALQQALADSGSGEAQDANGASPWGLFNDLAGRYFWYSPTGADPHIAYVIYEWATPGKVMSIVIHNRKGVAAAAELVLNDDGRRLLLASQYSASAVYGTAASHGDVAYEWTYSNNVPITDTLRRNADGTLSLTETRFQGGGWQSQSGAVQLSPTTKADIQAQGFKKVP